MESITLTENNDVALIPVTTDELGRMRLSKKDKEALLDAFERSSMSGLGFARKYGLTYSTFASWVRKRRESQGQHRVTKPTPGPLVEVTPLDPPAAGLVVELRYGSRLHLADTSQVQLAAELIKTLSR